MQPDQPLVLSRLQKAVVKEVKARISYLLTLKLMKMVQQPEVGHHVRFEGSLDDTKRFKGFVTLWCDTHGTTTLEFNACVYTPHGSNRVFASYEAIELAVLFAPALGKPQGIATTTEFGHTYDFAKA